MAARNRRREVVVGLFWLIAVTVDSVQARRNRILSDGSNDAEFAKPPRGTLKTIQGGGGDVVDCVDIYQQLAFDHPLLKNHTIQMKPSFFQEQEGESHQPSQGQPGLEEWGVDCPEGTIPIIRKTSKNHPDVKDYAPSFPFDIESNRSIKSFKHEYAYVIAAGDLGSFHGAQARLNVWNPQIEDYEFSAAKIWIIGGPTASADVVEAGWISDGYQSTGCYDLQCPGFVQTNKIFPLGSIIPSSTFNGKQTELYIEIKQDISTGNWWLRVKNVDLGYWPGLIFSSLRLGARSIIWGGEITNGIKNGQHTTTQMGSGHFPRDGYYTKSAYIRNIGYIKHDDPMQPTPKEDLQTYVTNRQCYDLVLGPSNLNFGTHFYFGGPGRSAQCPK
ncbi:uncharacterized protein LOC116199482 [Punica granatum]|uniref:Uncharacterized protein LOC116199482 n=1 Tax=Punica granatum TaxID=22663 RepID=A0A6P8CUB2_PUNGR|nr:uncharacterized protein LOC116199482 [Punica granatum]